MSASESKRPSDICLCLALTSGRYHSHGGDGWAPADAVRGALDQLGWKCSTQQVAAWLGRLSREEAAPVEVREQYGWREYRLTTFGRTWLTNRGFRVHAPWLAVYRNEVFDVR